MASDGAATAATEVEFPMHSDFHPPKSGICRRCDQRESDGVLYERIGTRTRVPCNTGGQRALKGKNGATGDATEKLEIIRVR